MHAIWKEKISYRRLGQGFPVVILHALGTDHRSMLALWEPLFTERTGWERIYLDVPAHGQSPAGEEIETTEDILSVILAFLDEIIPRQRFALIGKSFGGYLAQGILAKKTTLIDGLCLLAPALHIRERKLPERCVLEQDEHIFSGLDPDIRAAFETLMIVQNRQNLLYFLEEVQPGRLLADRRFLTSNWRTEGYFFAEDPCLALASYTAPTLFLLGRQDSICGYQDHWVLLEKFPHAAFSVLDGCGHMLDIEKRPQVQSLCADWLDRVESRVRPRHMRKGAL